MRKTLLALSVISAAFILGMSASDIVHGSRFISTDARATIGTDSIGSGFLIVKNSNGEPVFEVRDGSIYMHGERIDSGNVEVAAAPVADLPVVQLMEIEQWQPAPSAFAEIEEMRDEAKILEQDADYLDLKARGANQNSDRSRRIAAEHKRQAAEKRAKARGLRGRAARLERDLNEPKQVVHCWDGRREIVLRTTRDLTAQLTGIKPQGFLAFRGRRVGLDSAQEVFEIQMIEPAAEPLGFRKYSP